MKKFLTCCNVVLLLLLFATTSFSQLCNGSLGDPIVNIDFGSGANQGQPLAAGVTNYSFYSSCPNDGLYTIANSSPDCFSNSWHLLKEDHTPNDVNGYMMIVNASYSPGDFFVQTVSGLCGGTTYEFASWILNIEKASACGANPIKPNVTFQIQTTAGTVLMTHNTGDIPSTNTAEWKQYGRYFTTPPNVTSVVIRMFNNAPGGCGNDLVLDDITFRPCGATVSALIDNGSAVANVCSGDPKVFTFSPTVSGGNNLAYQWQVSTDNGSSWNDIAGATSLSYVRNPTAPGNYLYRIAVAEASNISSAKCRVVSNSITVVVHDIPNVKLTSNNPACAGDTLKLNAAAGGAYAWTGPAGFNSTLQTPAVNAITTSNNGTYCLTFTSAAGCTNSDCITVAVIERPAANAGPDVSVCEGASIILQGSGTATTYSWAPSAGLSSATVLTPNASPADTSTYVLTATSGSCRTSDTVRVFVWKKPTADAGKDQQVMQGSSIQLDGAINGTDVTYSWTPNYRMASASTLNPVVSPDTDTTYKLSVVSTHGCGTAVDDVFVRVYKKITVPNAFSPNGDGINDTWSIAMLNTYANADVVVFNRYGQTVFHSNGYAQEWNGTFHGRPLPVGTYYYAIDTKSVFGKFSGWVMILR